MTGLGRRSGDSQGKFLVPLAESLRPQISVSKVAVCYVSAVLDFERPFGVGISTLGPVSDGWISPSREGKRARADRSLRLRRRLESERPPLIRPGYWQVDETPETKAARQASFDCRLDDHRGKESKRRGHADRMLGLALSEGERLQSLARIGQKFV
jgi:hypothetical protein